MNITMVQKNRKKSCIGRTIIGCCGCLLEGEAQAPASAMEDANGIK